MHKLLPFFLLFVPLVTSAQAQPRNFKELVGIILGINQLLVGAIFALSFLVIAWTVINTWIIHGGEAKDVEEGKKVITVGVLVLVVMSGIWGILAILRSGVFGL